MGGRLELLVDPRISEQKFERELLDYRRLEDVYINRGWWLLKVDYPEVFVVFAAPQLKPSSVVFGILIDFTNYDFWPPSVRFVDPFSRAPIKKSELFGNLPYRIKSSEGGNMMGTYQIQDLIQAHSDDKAFLCLPGVREYHVHPAHTGDSWLTHRGRGEGTLIFLLETIYQHGVRPINSYNIQLRIAGFGMDIQQIPE